MKKDKHLRKVNLFGVLIQLQKMNSKLSVHLKSVLRLKNNNFKKRDYKSIAWMDKNM